MEKRIEITQLQIGYTLKSRPTPIHPPLNFTVYKGEMVCLIGPNGCGKSTLLRTLALLQDSLGGEIILNDNPIQSYSSEQLAAQIALVLTDSVRVDQMRVVDLIAMGRIPYRRWFHTETKRDIDAIETAIELTGTRALLDKPINSLSDGERQRCFIAKALAQEAPVILLDEPTAHLDVSGRIQTMTLLHKLASEHGKTILISTHELDFALQTADRIFLMSKGEGITEGVPEDIVLADRIGKTFCSDSVCFDLYTGNFMAIPKIRSDVTLLSQGVGHYTYWTKRALVRKGFNLIDNASILITVDERKKIWVIDTPTYTTSANSIVSLLEQLSVTTTK